MTAVMTTSEQNLNGVTTQSLNHPIPAKETTEQRLQLVLTTESSSLIRGTQREYSSKPLKHSIVKRILVFKR